jgi:membrane protein
MAQLIAIFRAAGTRFSEDGCGFMAQAIAFNAMFAVFPLLMLAFAAFGFIYGGAQGEARIQDLVSHLAPTVQPLIFDNAQHIVQFRGISGITAVVGLIWSGKNLFQTLAFSLDRALGVPKSRSLVLDVLTALVALPIIGVILLAATAVPVGISYVVTLGGFPHAAFLTQAAGYAAGIFLVFVVTMLLYAYLPNRRVSPWFGVPGAIVTTIAWEVSQIAFAIYSTHVDFHHVYGALATVAVLLLWFYYMAFIFLFGAQVSAQTLALRHPEAQAVRRSA